MKMMILKTMILSNDAAVQDVKTATGNDLEQRSIDPDLQDNRHNSTAFDPRFKSLPLA